MAYNNTNYTNTNYTNTNYTNTNYINTNYITNTILITIHTLHFFKDVFYCNVVS